MGRLKFVGAGAAILLLVGSGVALTNAPPEPQRPIKMATPNPARISYGSDETPVLLDAEQRPRRVESLLRIDKQMTYGESEWDEQGVPDGKIWIRVDRKAQMLSVFRAGHEIGTAVILYGATKNPTPTGTFKILQKSKNYRSIKYNAPMPYSLRLTDDGVAIHGSNVRFGAATHGCIGIPKDFAAKLFAEASVGDEVSLI